jgi:two-component system LytT family response regulator
LDGDRFASALQRARLQLERKSVHDLSRRLQSLLDDLKPTQKYTKRLVIKSAGRIFFLDVAEIVWIEAADNYVRLHAGRESHLLRETMTSLEKRLDPDQFVRVHRSRIINIRQLRELQPLFRGEYDIMLRDGTRLESGRGYREKLQKLFSGS